MRCYQLPSEPLILRSFAYANVLAYTFLINRTQKVIDCQAFSLGQRIGKDDSLREWDDWMKKEKTEDGGLRSEVGKIED